MRKQIVTTLAALAIAAAECTSSTADDPSVAAASEPAVTRTVTADDAIAVNDAYFAAYDAGDIDAMIELFTPDAEFMEPDFTTAIWQLLYEWKLAEGTEMLPRDCTTEQVEDRDAVAVECEYGQYEHLARAIDGPTVAHTMTMVVGPDGIDRLDDEFAEPGYGEYGEPFVAWLQAHHPDGLEAVSFEWESVEEAQRAGALYAELGDEWAAWLENNPTCTWRDTACQRDGAPEPADTDAS